MQLFKRKFVWHVVKEADLVTFNPTIFIRDTNISSITQYLTN